MVSGKEVQGSMKVAIEEVKREGGGGSEVMGKKKEAATHREYTMECSQKNKIKTCCLQNHKEFKMVSFLKN